MKHEKHVALEHVQAFVQIVRDGSFSKAARTLDISQPSISARIAALERSVGGRLFARGGRSLALTELGESFLPYAERTLATLYEGVETVRLIGDGSRGRVTIGTIQPLCGDFLARAVQRFHTCYPRIDLFVRVGHSEQVLEMLRDRIIRVGIIGGWPSDWYNPAVTVLHRVREPLALIVPAGSPLADQPAVYLRDVAALAPPLYLIEWTRALRTLVSQAITPAHALVELPFEMAYSFLLRGQGATFATVAMVSDDLAAGRLCAIKVLDMPQLYYENSIVALRETSLPRVVTAFLGIVEAEVLAMRGYP